MSSPRYLCFPVGERALDAGAQARVLHFLRHGEAIHQTRNAQAQARGEGCRCFEPSRGDGQSDYVCPYWSEDLIDAPLTERGRQQMLGRGAELPVDLVLCSPTARTLESSILAFPPQVPVLALPDLRPRVGRHMHSRCSPRSALVGRFPRVDFSAITDDEDRLWSPQTEPREALEQRAGRFLQTVFTLPGQRVAVVTHFTVLLALLLAADDTFTLGPSARPPGSPALLDCSGCPDPEALKLPVEVGDARSLLVVKLEPKER